MTLKFSVIKEIVLKNFKDVKFSNAPRIGLPSKWHVRLRQMV